MQLLRKSVSILLSLLTALSVFAIIPVTASAAEIGGSSVAEPEETISDKAHLQSNVQDGVILHAFNWSYNAIKEKLPEIAAAGYSTVQTSPVQPPRDYSTSTDVAPSADKTAETGSVVAFTARR